MCRQSRAGRWLTVRGPDLYCAARGRGWPAPTTCVRHCRMRQAISAGIMFAVIRTGGKQYKVAKDDVLSVERLSAEPGATIELSEVLMIGEGAEVATGTPLLDGASVSATVVEQTRAAKIIVFRSEEHTSELQSRFDLVCRL